MRGMFGVQGMDAGKGESNKITEHAYLGLPCILFPICPSTSDLDSGTETKSALKSRRAEELKVPCPTAQGRWRFCPCSM
jgi:hypothetical protein